MTVLGAGIGIAATGAWLPEAQVATASIVRAGHLEAEQASATATVSLAVSEENSGSGADFAVRAGQAALARAGQDPADLSLLVHAWINHQGHDFWSPAHYVADRLGATTAVPLGVQQMCNGGSVSLELAAARLLATPGTGPALVTTGDQFRGPGFDRWSGDYGVMYGDGGTALLLRPGTRPGDDFHLLSLVTVAAADLEQVHRGNDSFSPAPRRHGTAIDVRRVKKAFLVRHGSDLLTQRTLALVGQALEQALAQAGVHPDDPGPALVTVPRLGKAALEASYLPAIRALTPAPVLDLGTRTGHLGAGDTAANLHQIRVQELLAPGQTAVAISGGGGFSWSVAVVRRPPITNPREYS